MSDKTKALLILGALVAYFVVVYLGQVRVGKGSVRKGSFRGFEAACPTSHPVLANNGECVTEAEFTRRELALL